MLPTPCTAERDTMYQPKVSKEQIPFLDLIRGKDSSPPSAIVEFDARRPCLEIIKAKAKAKRGNSSQTTEECNAPALPSRAPPLLPPFGSQHEHQLPVTSGDINRRKRRELPFLTIKSRDWRRGSASTDCEEGCGTPEQELL